MPFKTAITQYLTKTLLHGIHWQLTNERPMARSNISTPASDRASDAHDIAAASAAAHAP